MMTIPIWVPILVSILSLCLSVFALGWNVYRDVILKPRLKVKFYVATIVPQGAPEFKKTAINLSATNFGPGKTKVEMIHAMYAPVWRRLIMRPITMVILPDDSNPMNSHLNQWVEPGDTWTHILPYEKRCILGENVTHVGVRDSFGRLHWASKSQVRDAIQSYRRDFGTSSEARPKSASLPTASANAAGSKI